MNIIKWLKLSSEARSEINRRKRVARIVKREGILSLTDKYRHIYSTSEGGDVYTKHSSGCVIVKRVDQMIYDVYIPEWDWLYAYSDNKKKPYFGGWTTYTKITLFPSAIEKIEYI